jgi:hypothetical protein
VECFEEPDEFNDPKVIGRNNNKIFIVLYNFQENPCCIVNIFGNIFDIVIYWCYFLYSFHSNVHFILYIYIL